MRILLVEPDYRRPAVKRALTPGKHPDDDTLWYPPLGLMKLARYHRNRGDEIRFVVGRDPNVLKGGPLFPQLWDRVYITTLFTFHFEDVVKTIDYYIEAVGGTISKIYVGGVMATLMRDEIYNKTGVLTIPGILDSATQIGMPDDISIDLLPPDYSIVDDRYGIRNTFYAYTTRGCRHKCAYCGVHRLEPKFIPYIDIKDTIRALRQEQGDKPVLKLMDNNVLGSSELDKIVDDLIELGYGRNKYTETKPRRLLRRIDFNQGLDATHLTEKNMALLSRINIEPMRIAFDNVRKKKEYVRAIRLANKYGVRKFSNYMLYNFEDTPKDLYERLKVNIELNEEYANEGEKTRSGKIYSYPMRFAPIADPKHVGAHKTRDIIHGDPEAPRDWLREPIWTKRFIRNIEIMRGAANGAISPSPPLAWRTIGHTFEEFLANLYMPEELIRNRNRHEGKIYDTEPERDPGTGKVEEFRSFIIKLLTENGERFMMFHKAISRNSQEDVRTLLHAIQDKEMKKWLKLYQTRKISSPNPTSLLEVR